MIFKKMEERIPLVLEKKLPPLLIYPEGTCSNGYALMNFKKGAFLHTAPIKIHALKYNAEFAPSFNTTHPFVSLFFSTAQLWGNLEAFEVEEPLDPLWVAKKYGLEKNDPQLWEYVANEIKEIISSLTGNIKTESGIDELVKYEDSEARGKFDFKLKLCVRKCKVSDFGNKEKSKFLDSLEKKMI